MDYREFPPLCKEEWGAFLRMARNMQKVEWGSSATKAPTECMYFGINKRSLPLTAYYLLGLLAAPFRDDFLRHIRRDFLVMRELH